MKKTLAATFLLVLLLAVLAVFFLHPKGGEEGRPPYTFTRDWLDKGNLWVFDQPPPGYLEEVGATGTAFSVYYGGVNEEERDYVETLHRHGFKVTANFPTVQSKTTENLRLRAEAAKRDIYGNPIQFLGEKDLYEMCGNHPLWREFLISRIEEQARGGVDGILIDEPGELGNCFCDYCMQAFNDYLAEHYSPEELQRLFGITDLSSFSYREYLLDHGGEHYWDDPNPQLQVAYLEARYWSRREFIAELIQRARQAAGWDIPVTANTYGLMPNQQIFVPLLDFVIFEIPVTSEVNPTIRYLRPLPGKNLTTYLLAEALDPEKPFSAFPDVFELLHLSEDEWWLWRHWLAEARACGASFMLPYRAYVYGGGSYILEADKISPYTRFFAGHPQYYENLERAATVALLHDLHSTLTNRYTWQANLAWESFENLGMLLQEAHVPFEVLYRGDGIFVQKSLTLEDLRKYGAIIIPRYYDLDSGLQALLSQYSSLGGKVVRCEDFPRDELLVPTLKGLVADLGLETNASGDLGVVVYRRGDSLLLHLLNYSYDRGTRDFLDLTDLQFTLTVPEGVRLEGKTLKLVSPDAPESTLEYTLENGRVTFTVPNLHCYSLVSFE